MPRPVSGSSGRLPHPRDRRCPRRVRRVLRIDVPLPERIRRRGQDDRVPQADGRSRNGGARRVVAARRAPHDREEGVEEGPGVAREESVVPVVRRSLVRAEPVRRRRASRPALVRRNRRPGDIGSGVDVRQADVPAQDRRVSRIVEDEPGVPPLRARIRAAAVGGAVQLAPRDVGRDSDRERAGADDGVARAPPGARSDTRVPRRPEGTCRSRAR